MKKLILLSLFVFHFIGCGDSQNKKNEPSDPSIDTLSYCKSLPLGNRPITYCVDTDEISARKFMPSRVIYFFHGINGSATDLFKGELAQVLKSVKSTMGNLSPIFVGLSVGQQGLLKKNEAADLNQIIFPEIEVRLGFRSEPQRDLIGLSMGGHNALVASHGDKSRIQNLHLLCPALINFNPFEQNEISQYIARHSNMDLPFLQKVLSLFQQEFPNFEDWNTNNPFALLEQGDYQHLKSIFISVGRRDTLGFDEGSLSFFRNANKAGLKVRTALVDGKHCAFDRVRLTLAIIN
jgi:hypothetical protein